MKHRIKIALVATALTLAGAGFTTPAHATGYSDTLIASSCVDITSPGVQTVGGGGSFSGPAACAAPFNLVPDVCVGVSDSDGAVSLPNPGEAGTCTIGATNGTYINIACGTGLATGTVEITESGGSTDTYSFTIVFAAGQGVIVINGGSDDGTEIGAGVVDILPSKGDCVNGVTQFRFTAVVPLVADL
jgi:hypothetical protein